MAGALAERVFVDKMAGVGFAGIEVLEHRSFSLADVESIPLFTPDLLDVARRLLTVEQQREIAVAITVSAHKSV